MDPKLPARLLDPKGNPPADELEFHTKIEGFPWGLVKIAIVVIIVAVDASKFSFHLVKTGRPAPTKVPTRLLEHMFIQEIVQCN